jgi:hypothetical protein
VCSSSDSFTISLIMTMVWRRLGMASTNSWELYCSDVRKLLRSYCAHGLHVFHLFITAFAIHTFLLIFLSALYLNIEPILLLLGQDPLVSRCISWQFSSGKCSLISSQHFQISSRLYGHVYSGVICKL